MLTATGFLYTADVIRRALQNWAELVTFTGSTTANYCLRNKDIINTTDLHCLCIDIGRALVALTVRQRKAVCNHLMEGHSLEETAICLHISVVAAHRLIRRAIERLVGRLNGEHLLKNSMHPPVKVRR